MSSTSILSLTERHAAIDANAFSQEPPKDADIDPLYTLGDQLFVEPQPLVLPTQLELNAPIRMSRAEIAVARSHINVWRKVAASDHAYGLILEDDVWFHSGFTPDVITMEDSTSFMCRISK
jgi:GR25 family glycosyltransferase involved in LPS biosynthesis